MAYSILTTIFGHMNELIAIHKEANNIVLKDNALNKFVPYHKGAQKYFKERGINVLM